MYIHKLLHGLHTSDNLPLEKLAEQRDIAGIKEHIAAIEALSRERDKDYDNTWNKVFQANTLITFIEEDAEDKKIDIGFSNGIISLGYRGTTFLVSANQKKWRVKGKAQWYRYKNEKDLLKRYVLK